MRKEKQLLLDEIKETLNRSDSFVLTSYSKMNPNQASDLREKIIETGGVFYVIKKRVFLKAVEELGLPIKQEMLNGHCAFISSGEDAVATTKAFYAFKNENSNIIQVLGGLFEGDICSEEEFQEISKLPGKNEIRAQLLGVLEAPMSGVLSVIEGAMSGLISCMDQKVQKEESNK